MSLRQELKTTKQSSPSKIKSSTSTALTSLASLDTDIKNIQQHYQLLTEQQNNRDQKIKIARENKQAREITRAIAQLKKMQQELEDINRKFFAKFSDVAIPAYNLLGMNTELLLPVYLMVSASFQDVTLAVADILNSISLDPYSLQGLFLRRWSVQGNLGTKLQQSEVKLNNLTEISMKKDVHNILNQHKAYFAKMIKLIDSLIGKRCYKKVKELPQEALASLSSFTTSAEVANSWQHPQLTNLIRSLETACIKLLKHDVEKLKQAQGKIRLHAPEFAGDIIQSLEAEIGKKIDPLLVIEKNLKDDLVKIYSLHKEYLKLRDASNDLINKFDLMLEAYNHIKNKPHTTLYMHLKSSSPSLALAGTEYEDVKMSDKQHAKNLKLKQREEAKIAKEEQLKFEELLKVKQDNEQRLKELREAERKSLIDAYQNNLTTKNKSTLEEILRIKRSHHTIPIEDITSLVTALPVIVSRATKRKGLVVGVGKERINGHMFHGKDGMGTAHNNLVKKIRKFFHDRHVTLEGLLEISQRNDETGTPRKKGH